MKKSVYFGVILFVLLAACKKANTTTDDSTTDPNKVSAADTAGIPDGCISRIYFNPLAVLLSPADLAAANQLFHQNNLSATNLQFYAYTNDPCPTCVTPGPYQFVRANQYFNKQLIFNADVSFAFRQGIYTSTSGTLYGNIPLDTLSASRLSVLRKLYINQLNKDSFFGFRTYKDSCLVAQFGYEYLRGTDTSSVIKPANYAKVWKIKPKNRDYPEAYFKDDQQNTLLYYFNGIIIF